MQKINWKSGMQTLGNRIQKKSPEILTGIGIAGMITTVFLAVKATPKAMRLIAENSGTSNLGVAYAPNKRETVKLCWKTYIPAAVTGTVSIACLIFASSANGRRNAALAVAYELSETAFKEYRDKVVETVGEKKEQAVQDAVAKEQMRKNPVENREIILTNNGDTLCLDMLSGRYFKSSVDKLKRAETELNRQMNGETYVSLNDFYYLIGLPPLQLIGDKLGWNGNKGHMSLRFSAQLTEDETPCLVMGYWAEPYYKYAD